MNHVSLTDNYCERIRSSILINISPPLRTECHFLLPDTLLAIMTTSVAASDEKFVNMITFRCSVWHHARDSRFDVICWGCAQSNFIDYPLQWRHNERDGVSNHQPHNCQQIDCLLNNDQDNMQHKKHIKAPHYVRGLHRSTMDSHHKGPVMRKSFPYHDVIMTKKFNERLD